MKLTTQLTGLTAILTSALLTSCYMPPGGYYPPAPGGGGGNPGGGGGGIIIPPPAPIKKKVLDSYTITSIQVYKLPFKRSGALQWDARNPLLGPKVHYPDVFSTIKSRGSTVATSITRQDHNPASYTMLTVSSRRLNYNLNTRLHISMYDRDKNNNDLMAGYNITVPKPATGVTNGYKTVKYRNSNGDVYYRVNFRYNWVLR